MSKLTSSASGYSPVLLNNNNVISISSLDTNLNSKVHVDGHLNNAKIAKIVKILLGGSLDKVKEIIEADIDVDFNSHLINETNLGDDYLLDIFKVYLKSYNYNMDRDSIFKSIINKLDTRSSLKKCEDLVKASHSLSASLKHNLLNQISVASSKIPNSIDFIKDD
jgi:hypothetical protein